MTLEKKILGGNSSRWPPNIYVKQRDGQVLGRGMVLKSDHIPSEDKGDLLDTHVSGTPNFRTLQSMSIHACGQPTLYGINTIVNLLDESPIRWICLREEPLIYINQRSFVLREAEHPFRNLRDFQGINYQRLEDLERRLKSDILAESSLNNGIILVHIETSKRSIRSFWEAVSPDSVFTSRELYDSLLQSKNRSILYSRVPVTPLSCFSRTDLDHIVRTFSFAVSNGQKPTCWHYIFNCQMGIGRSTMASAAMLLLFWHSSGATVSPVAQNSDLDRIVFVQRATRILIDGPKVKNRVDAALDAAGILYDLRKELLLGAQASETVRDPREQKVLMTRARQSLERYFQLICFAEYLESVPTDWKNNVCFSSFMETQPALLSLEEHLKSPTFSFSIFSPSPTTLSRTGSLLQTDTILKNSFCVDCRSSLPGAPNFRLIKSFPVAALAQPSLTGIQSALDSFPDASSVLWLDLQVDPIVFIKGQPFLLRDSKHPFRCLDEFNVALGTEKLILINNRLKQDVLDEIAEHGRILVHIESEVCELSPSYIEASIDDVETPEALFGSMKNLHYAHVPIRADLAPTLTAFDRLYEELDTRVLNSALIFHCQMGRGRSTLGQVVSVLLFHHRSGKEFPMPSYSEDALSRGEYRGILGLIRILKRGRGVKEEVDAVIDLCGERHNLRDIILISRDTLENERSAASELGLEQQAVAHLVRYALLICFNSYLHDVHKNKLPKFVPFSLWMQDRSEIGQWLSVCEQDPTLALAADFSTGSQEFADVYASRRGNVLVNFSILKCDYFPGCQNKKLKPTIDGAPNYRMIKGFPVGGTAIPTQKGVCNVLEQLENMNGADSLVFWVNLREEPVLYINNRPFCLRDVDNPYRNLEYTGISTERVEAMEKQLKRDVLEEAVKYNGQFLLHDETDDGVLVGVWENVDEASVLTSSEMYTSVLRHKKSPDTSPYCRIPITDEQAPLPATFDAITDFLETAHSSSSSFIFNCQMGRGRTTTGIVICCLWFLHRGNFENDSLSQYDERGLVQDTHTLDDAFCNGDYRSVTALVRMLNNGVAIKAQVDELLNHCSEMQNLRTSVFNLKKRAETLAKPKQREEILDRAINYLSRYVLLILFNAYLIETDDSSIRFSTWLSHRPEMEYILKSLDLS